MRRAIGVVVALVGLAAVIYGVTIAFGDPYDIGRTGLVLLSLPFIVPGLGILIGGVLLIRVRGLGRERYCPRSGQSQAEAGEHRQVSVERDPLDAANAKRRQPVLVLQAPELTLDGSATPVKLPESF